MTSLLNLRNKQVIITRLLTVSGNKRAYATTTAAWVEIQPVSFSKQDVGGGVMNKLYKMFMDPTADIQEADMLRETSNGKHYKVRTGGVNRRTQGSIDYIEVVMELTN